MNSAAAIVPPTDFVYARNLPASTGVQAPSASRVPGLVANEVTILASTARANSTTSFHRERVRMPPKPFGGVWVARSESAKYVVFAQVPLTRTYAGPSVAASLRRRALVRSIGGR